MSYQVVDSISEEQQLVVQEVESWVESRSSYPVIANDDDYAKAGEDLRTIKSMVDKVEKTRVTITGPLNTALKAANDFFRGPFTKLSIAEANIKARLGQYNAARKAKEREVQEKANREAEKQRARLLNRAAKAEEKGQDSKAALLEMQAAHVIAPSVALPTPALRGISLRESWTFEIVDETKVPRAFLSLDMAKIRAHVRVHKGASNIDGVRVYEESQVVARS